ncbi:cytochrome P450 6B7 [Amyelois transitella]|uniref:cytochrome P450 6B7 n=1 Tax=Amyelois transitella TaxID=680683 RepID=UPI00067BB83C|nr:cytochrome P450 6B7 [Amyelois transitella]
MIVILLVFAVVAFYLYATRNYDYWNKRNVKHDPPVPPFGTHFRNAFAFKSITDISQELYNKYPNEKVVGYYRWSTPELIIKDPDVVRRIMSTDFNHFYFRGMARNPKVDRVLLNPFHADGDNWRLLRQRLTPAFTTAKLKNMFPLIVKCAEKLHSLGDDIVSRGGDCDIREMMARFTTEFIGACGFGVEMDTINNEKSLFREFGKLIFSRTAFDITRFAVWEAVPLVRGFLPVINPKIEEIATEIVKNVREQRNGKPSGRNDFIDLLLELESKGKFTAESIEKTNPDGSPVIVDMEMTMACMAAQVFIFFAAGFETSSSATSFTLHELAFNPEIQERIQEEIDEVLSEYNNKLCYEAVAKLSLLDMAFKEAMRMFPSLGIVTRECTRPCTIPELGISIDPGVKIVIPIQAIQNDEKYFDNPTEFRPERFTPEEVKNRQPFTYMPFGDGPRMCIGARLGQMQSLAGLAAVLQRFTVEPNKDTRRKPQVNPRSNVVQGLVGGLPLKLTLRKNKTASK